MEEVLLSHRMKRHRLEVLNEVEGEIEELRSRRSYVDDDIALWRQDGNRFANLLSTKKTWLYMRRAQPVCNWNKGVWFPQSTPKFFFMLWVTVRNRLQTCDRMQKWNATLDTLCILCKEEQETCRHLFFKCRYSEKIWKNLVRGIMKEKFTVEWNEVLETISQLRSTHTATELFLIRYASKALVHSIWRERNACRHGEQPRDESVLMYCVDKLIRLKFLQSKEKGRDILRKAYVFGLDPDYKSKE